MVSRETLLNEYFTERQKEALRYGEILETWGIERGLIGPKEGDRIWGRHIANCIPVTTLIPQGATVADVGSGAGLPGIVIALARPDLTVTLIEPLQRRTTFLEEVVAELALPITVLRGKSEAIKGSFDVVTARAVAPLTRLIPMTWHLVKPGGALLAIKGESAADEIAEAGKGQLHLVELPDFEPARIVEVRK